MDGCSIHHLLIGVVLVHQAQAGFKCPQSNGYFPDPDNCQIYYRCVDGGWHRHSCGPGTAFNPIHNTCDYPNKVQGCLHGGKSPPGTAAPEPPYPTTQYRTTKSRATEYPPTRYPPTQYPPTRYPPTDYPPTDEPPTEYPPTRYPPTRYPPTRYQTTSRYNRQTTPKRDYGKFKCTSDGYFGHPTYCDHFYRCVMTRPILFQCAPGTYFDDKIGTCNYKERITECDEDGIKHGGPGPTYRPSRRPSQRPTHPPTQGPSRWPTQEVTHWTSATPSYSAAFSDYFTTTTAFPTTSAEIFICPNRCGFYPHPTRCDQFVVCMDFEAKVHTCPPELYFNWQAKTCDYKENVQCYINNFQNMYKKK